MFAALLYNLWRLMVVMLYSVFDKINESDGGTDLTRRQPEP